MYKPKSIHITLLPKKANLNFAHSLSGVHPRTISFDCGLQSGGDIRLAVSQCSLRSAAWVIFLTEDETFNQSATGEGAIGFIRYISAQQFDDDALPETCHSSIALKPEVFTTLISVLQKGILPKEILIDVGGLDFGNDPDGSDLLWNVDENSALPIFEVDFFVPLPITGAVLEDDELVAVSDPAVGQRSLLEDIRGRLSWLCALSIIITLLIFFRH